MRRGGGGGGGARLPKPSLASSSAFAATPALGSSLIRNLDSAFSRRDSDAASICSSRPASTVGRGGGAGAGAAPNFSDRATQAAALRFVNAYLSPAVTLRGPLPAARDIQAALRLLAARVDLPPNDATFEDDLILDLRGLGCPYKVTRSALKAPGTPHAWPAVLSILYWLTVFASTDDMDESLAQDGPPDQLLLYTTESYSHFLRGDDLAVVALDEEYISRVRKNGEESIEEVRRMEKEAKELKAQVDKLTSGPSQLEALGSQKAALQADALKFEEVVKTWKTKVNEKEQALLGLHKELEAKRTGAKCAAAEIEDLLKKVDAQPVKVSDMDRMRRELQVVEDDIAKAEKGKAALEDEIWEVEAKLISKLEEIERLAEQCNQALKRLKPGIAFEYMINSKGSSPAEMLGTGYKTVLKPALVARTEESKRICLSNLEELNYLHNQLQGNDKVLEEERSNISSLQANNDEMVARLNSLDRKIANDDSRFTSEARQMRDELEKEKKSLVSVEKEADDFLKTSEKRLQEAILKAGADTQVAANELLALVDSMAEYKEFVGTTIAQRRRDLYETADYIASLASQSISTTQASNPPDT